MGGLAGAWAVGMGITVWRQVKQSAHLPVPADLVAVTGLFLVLGLVADMSTKARMPVTLIAWGLDVAGLLRVLPLGLYQETNTAITANTAAETGTASSSTGG